MQLQTVYGLFGIIIASSIRSQNVYKTRARDIPPYYNKMRKVVLLAFLCVGVWSEETDFRGWHEKVGIKHAEEIAKLEQVQLHSPIVGGAIAPINFHPYLAGIVIDLLGQTRTSACGGSLISSTRVLTAAHCWNDGRMQASGFTVVLGTPYLYHGGQRIQTHTLGVHPRYDSRTLANDIAILYLPVHVQFSSTIQPIQLPTGLFQTYEYTGHWATASGYGRYADGTSPTINTMVRHVMLPVISVRQCQAFYHGAIQDSNICTSGWGGVGICQGDSGGPLTVSSNGQPILIGVSSFVAQDGCQLGYPSAFASVPYFLSWIQSHL